MRSISSGSSNSARSNFADLSDRNWVISNSPGPSTFLGLGGKGVIAAFTRTANTVFELCIAKVKKLATPKPKLTASKNSIFNL
jgi:hypothetical protein